VIRRHTATVKQSREGNDAVRLDIDERESGEERTASQQGFEMLAIPIGGDGYDPKHRFDLVRIVRPGLSIVTSHPSIEAAMERASKEYELTHDGWSVATDATANWRRPEAGVLEQELVPLLRAHGTRCAYQRTPVFLDIAWDGDMTVDEMNKFDWALIIDASAGPQRIAIQRIRDQIRYWFTTDRDPYANAEESELGWVDSLADAAALCNEVLSGATSVAMLKTPRFTGRERRGDHR
jgi:hypothetical protein